MAGFSREVARRIFIEELKSSNYSFRDGEDQHQYAPQYLLTPTGAKCNRVFMVVTLTEKDDIGGDTEYWRGRVVDPTGSILIYAGQYQPEATQILSNIEAPAFVAVVGKPNLYQTEDGNIIISVRAESIQRVDEITRNLWIMDTARRTLERLKMLQSAGPACSPSQDAQKAIEHYHADVEHYRQMVLRALTTLQSDLSSSRAEPKLEPAKKLEVKTEPTAEVKEKVKPDAKRSRVKKSSSLAGLTDQDDLEEVEEVPIFKRPVGGGEGDGADR